MKHIVSVTILCLVTLIMLACGRGSAPMFEGTAAQDAVNEIKKKAGGDLKLISLRINPDNVEVTSQDLKNPDKVVRYEYRNGAVSDPKPVTLIGGNLADSLYNLADVDLAAIPNMAKTTKEKVNVSGAEIESMELSYSTIRTDEKEPPKWTITAKSGEKKRSAVADIKGNITYVSEE